MNSDKFDLFFDTLVMININIYSSIDFEEYSLLFGKYV